MEAIPAHSANWDVSVRGGIRLAQTLNEMRTEVALYKRLAILAEDVPLAEDLEDLRWRGADREEFERLDQRLGGGTMRPRRWRGR